MYVYDILFKCLYNFPVFKYHSLDSFQQDYARNFKTHCVSMFPTKIFELRTKPPLKIYCGLFCNMMFTTLCGARFR